MSPFLARYLPGFVLLLYVIAATLGAFNGGMWAGLGIGGGLVLFFGIWRLDRRAPSPDKSLVFMALALLALAAGLNFNSSQPALSWHEWLRLVTVFLPLCALLVPAIPSRALHPKFFTILPVAVAIGALTLGLEFYLGDPLLHRLRGAAAEPAGYNRGVSYIVLLGFPLMAALVRSKNRGALVLFVLILLVPASLAESRTAKLALMLALPIIALAQVAPAATRRLLALTPFGAIGWPFAARWVFTHHYDWLAHIPDSWRARVEIWDYMSYRIMEKPLLGWGLGTSVTLDFKNPHGALYVITNMPAAHPHNVMTQLWVELGLPGLALGVIFALLILYKASRLDERLMPFALGAWVAGFCFCLLAYNFWTDSLFACFALTGFAFMLLEQKLRLTRSSPDAPVIR